MLLPKTSGLTAATPATCLSIAWASASVRVWRAPTPIWTPFGPPKLAGKIDRRLVPSPASRAWTDLVITPERGVRIVDGLLTGFHEPRASHLAMLEAIAGRTHLERAYAAALAARYLWHEFGDLHLILP